MDSIEDTVEDVQAYLKRSEPTRNKRILLLGSSQLFGSGAAKPSDRIAVRLCESLTSMPQMTGTIIVNGSAPGTNSLGLLKRCKSHLHLFNPAIVLIVLSNNDRVTTFQSGVEALLNWSTSIGAKTVFIMEPNTLESNRKELLSNYEIMRNVGNRNQVPVLNLQSYLSKPEIIDSGILWWDVVHLTSYGQRITGGFLAEYLKSLTAKAPSTPRKNSNFRTWRSPRLCG